MANDSAFYDQLASNPANKAMFSGILKKEDQRRIDEWKKGGMIGTPTLNILELSDEDSAEIERKEKVTAAQKEAAASGSGTSSGSKIGAKLRNSATQAGSSNILDFNSSNNILRF